MYINKKQNMNFYVVTQINKTFIFMFFSFKSSFFGSSNFNQTYTYQVMNILNTMVLYENK